MFMRWINIAAFLAVCLVAGGLFYFKHTTRDLKAEAAKLEREIRSERDNIAILKTEWGHLTRPARLERLAREYLDMEPAKTNQVKTPKIATGALPRKKAKSTPEHTEVLNSKQPAPKSIEDILQTRGQ